MTEFDALIAHLGVIDDSLTDMRRKKMSLALVDLAPSRSLRCSLKRGLARQSLENAARMNADLPKIFRIAADFRPNRKAMERVAQRLSKLPGVVRTGLAKDGVVVTTRNTRDVVTRVSGADAFCETAVIYTRIEISCCKLGVRYGVARASFCKHALERLVERSSVGLDGGLLARVDVEAVRLLGCVARGELIEDDKDQFVFSKEQGLWAGALDLSAVEPDWGGAFEVPNVVIPIFSVRTFLGENEIRPTLWLKWKGDPALVAA